MKGPLQSEKGIALFLVLWVLMLLSVIVGEFCHAMRTEVNIARNFTEETRAYYIARAGVNIALNQLLKQQSRPRGLAAAAEAVAEDPWRINRSMPAFSYGGGAFRARVTDEGGKVNINRAGPRLLRAMLSGFDLNEEERDIIVDSILDWRDGDNFHRLNGAEEDYYQSLAEPYHARNGDFASTAELQLVRGVTPEMVENGLMEMVTVFPGTRDGSDDASAGGGGSPFDYSRLCVNAVPGVLLRSLPGMNQELADAVVEHREARPFRSTADVISVLGEAYGAVSPFLTIQESGVYAVAAVGYAAEGADGAEGSGSALHRGVMAVVEATPDTGRKYRVLAWLDNIGAGF
jgi:general secretion pathway protein K